MAKLTQSTQQGVIQADGQYLWAQTNNQQFKFGAAPSLSAEHNFIPAAPTLVELGGQQPVFRKTHLPFNNDHKIQAVLPQEAADTLINPLKAPRFAFSTSPAAQGSEVFYAVIEAEQINTQLADLAANGIKAQALTAPGLGAWPLLIEQNIIAPTECVWVMDASVQPQAFYQLKANKLQNIQLVGAATQQQGTSAIAQELAWYLNSNDNTATCRLVCLGMDAAFWHPVTSKFKGPIDIPELQQLLPTADHWHWIRPAGLALANTNAVSKQQMLDFQQQDAANNNWQTWLKPWRIPAILAATLVLLIGIQLGSRYIELQNQYSQLQQNIRDTFKQAMPGKAVLVDPERQLRQAIATGGQGTYRQQLRQWIAYIQQTVPDETGVAWHQLVYDQGSIQLMGEIDSFEQLDAVKQHLQNIAAVKVQQAQIMRGSKRVRFTLELD